MIFEAPKSQNKRDRQNPKVRGRLVAQEVNTGQAADDFYAATPPLEALRFLLSLAMTLPRVNGEDWVLVYIDISRAHPHCEVQRRIVVELPPEAAKPGFCCKLRQCLYGTVMLLNNGRGLPRAPWRAMPSGRAVRARPAFTTRAAGSGA